MLGPPGQMPSMTYPPGPKARDNEDVIECGTKIKPESPLAGLTVEAANCTLGCGYVESAVDRGRTDHAGAIASCLHEIGRCGTGSSCSTKSLDSLPRPDHLQVRLRSEVERFWNQPNSGNLLRSLRIKVTRNNNVKYCSQLNDMHWLV